MPERWERELRKLRGVEPNEHVIRERAEHGASPDRRPPRRNAIVAGIAAGAVAIAGVAVLGQLSLDDGREIGDADDLPVLVVTFESNGFVVDQPDEQIQRVDTMIVYGDAREESFTSTISENAHVDWVAAGDLTRFVPGPTAGSPVRIEADGENARVLIGEPADWPEFERFTPIDHLPDVPGEYVLVLEADYPDGVARTARAIRVAPPGALQLVVTEGKRLYSATALAYVDGRRTDGFLSRSWFTLGDSGARSDPVPPDFGSDHRIELLSGSPTLLASTPSEAHAGVVPGYEDFTAGVPLPIDLLGAEPTLEASAGRQLLVVDVTWRHGSHPLREEETEERAIFFFPIEIVPAPGEREPSPDATPSPAPVAPDVVTIDIRRSSEETGDPEAIARFGSREVWMCPDGWTVVNPDGTQESITFDCGQSDEFLAPAGTPILVTGDIATVEVTARMDGERLPRSSDVVPALAAGSVLTLGYEVTWDDGSEASFWLLLTVQDAEPSPGEPRIFVRIHAVGERSNEVPTITMTYGGETRSGCTIAYEWTLADGTKVDEGAGGGVLPTCDLDPVFEVPPDTPIVVIAGTATQVFATRTTTPFYDGPESFGASVRWPDGRGDFTVPFDVVGSPTAREIELHCAGADRIPFTAPDGPRILPGGSAYITGNLEGFLPDDVVEQMTRDAGGEWDGVWQVVRRGSVIAAVDFGSLGGVACRGSGIGGV